VGDVDEALGRDEELEAPIVALQEAGDAEDEGEVAEELGGGEELVQARRSLVGARGARNRRTGRAPRVAPVRSAWEARVMELEIPDYGTVDVSTAAELERALAVLGTEGVGYATLAHGGTMIQASQRSPQRFLVEYGDGVAEKLYRTRCETFTREDVVSLFTRYLEGDAGWRDALEWELVDLPMASLSSRRRKRSWSPAKGSVLNRDVTGLGLVLLVLVLLAISTLTVWVWNRDRAFVERAGRATGTVVRNPSSPVIRFETSKGAPVEFRSSVTSSPPRYALGQRVAVLYDPEEPRNARIDGSFEVMGRSIILAAVCAVFWTIALAIVLGAWQQKVRHARRARLAR
jgi:hypothetical protein